MKRFWFSVIVLVLAMPLLAFAGGHDKVTICHAAGREGTTHYITLTISENAVYGRHGQAGHFNENGTTRAGHEQDYFGPCKEDTSSGTPSPTPVPTVTETPTMIPVVTPTPSLPTPTATPTPFSGTTGGGSTRLPNTSISN